MAGTAADGSEQALVQVKNNLGQFGKSIGYTIEADGSFRWTGESELTPEAILAPSCTEKDRSAVDEAADFLREELRQGPRSAKEIETEARQAGIASRTLKRAKGRLRVVSSKDGIGRRVGVVVARRGPKVIEGCRNLFLASFEERWPSSATTDCLEQQEHKGWIDGFR